MKMVFLSYKESQHDEVMEIFEDLEVAAYTRFNQVQAKFRKGRPRMGTHIWPGFNSAVLLAIEAEKVPELMARIREFNDKTEFEGISAMCWALEEACWK
ncbi:MAG: hypothetical protein E3J45_08245 [Candidatus Zixiibacteriota bacterium]|nr:MAG: hypothetical protein E3J45_08245 [candidate division Zixibacteria bacterium]